MDRSVDRISEQSGMRQRGDRISDHSEKGRVCWSDQNNLQKAAWSKYSRVEWINQII